MLIKALCDYYDVKEGSSASSGNADLFSKQSVSFMIFLSRDGEISGILDIRNEKKVSAGKDKTKSVLVPREITLPKRSQKPGIDLNIIEHRPLYIFGLNYDKKTGIFSPDDRTKKAEKSHALFTEGNLEFCEGLESDIICAYRNFLLNWKPEEQTENPFLKAISKDYSSSYYCFAFDGDERILLHEDKALLEKYAAKIKEEQENKTDEISAVCPIEGRNLPVARIHEKIKGIRGGNSVGGVLVGVKNSAFESYGKTQSYNSGISEVAMMKYTATLNKLLADPKHSLFIDEMSMVFFAIDRNDEAPCEVMSDMLSGSKSNELQGNVSSVAGNIPQGSVGNLSALKTHENLLFYVAGLTPNSSRISQKFVIRNSFGKIIANLEQHQRDLQIKEGAGQIPLLKLKAELVSPKSREEKAPPPLLSALLMSMLNGTNYPFALLETVVRRVKSDSNEEKNQFIKINDTRVSIIKACLNRKARFMNQKEEITMALDETNTNPAYLCGRLFAVLEKLQKDAYAPEKKSDKTKKDENQPESNQSNKAAGKGLNRTIKDAYFGSACVRPATVLPKLMLLSQHHLSKLDSEVSYSKMIGGIISLIDGEFPQTLSLEDQGKFIIGYYQQNNVLYTGNDKKEKQQP